MEVRYQFRPYRRRFRSPLKTAHGLWNTRQGLLLKVEYEQDNQLVTTYGECAPIPEFGTETLEEAGDWLRRKKGECQCPDDLDETFSSSYPALRSAFSMALRSENQMSRLHEKMPVTWLLPHGEQAVDSLSYALEKGYRHFKWKITTEEPVQTYTLFLQLIKQLPEDARLCLDANGSLDNMRAKQWLRYLDGAKVSWLEQPLPPAQEEDLWKYANHYQAPIALDESVTTVQQMRHFIEAGWPGAIVVKPSLMGSLESFLELREKYRPTLIYSTSFETSIGIQYLLQLAASDPCAELLPLGIGALAHLRDDGLCFHEFGAQVMLWGFQSNDFEPLWESLENKH